MSSIYSYKNHLTSSDSLVTPYEATRAGFVALALEKNRKATPFVNEAKALKANASIANTPNELLQIESIQTSLLTAAGISDKAKNHLTDGDKREAIKGLIRNFLDPAGNDFIEELVYRFLLTRGDSLGGSIRNIAGTLGERKFIRVIISTLSIAGRNFYWMHSKTKRWLKGSKDDSDIEMQSKGLCWKYNGQPRTLICNLTAPIVGKNIDYCLFNCKMDEIIFGKNTRSAYHKPQKYIALGELKGGIDPAGADEHWKTGKSALRRIRKAFSELSLTPYTFFIGAAIEKSMAEEIYDQLQRDTLTNDNQLFSICNWLVQL